MRDALPLVRDIGKAAAEALAALDFGAAGPLVSADAADPESAAPPQPPLAEEDNDAARAAPQLPTDGRLGPEAP